MKKQLSLRRVVGSIAAAVLAAAAVWLLCRWVGYDLQLRVGNQPVYEIVNDDYTRVIDLPEALPRGHGHGRSVRRRRE